MFLLYYRFGVLRSSPFHTGLDHVFTISFWLPCPNLLALVEEREGLFLENLFPFKTDNFHQPNTFPFPIIPSTSFWSAINIQTINVISCNSTSNASPWAVSNPSPSSPSSACFKRRRFSSRAAASAYTAKMVIPVTISELGAEFQIPNISMNFPPIFQIQWMLFWWFLMLFAQNM